MTMSTQEMSDGISPDAVNVYCTCRVEGCANFGHPIFSAELYGTPMCGVCSTDITDIADTPPELPTEMPAWEL